MRRVVVLAAQRRRMKIFQVGTPHEKVTVTNIENAISGAAARLGSGGMHRHGPDAANATAVSIARDGRIISDLLAQLERPGGAGAGCARAPL